MPVLVAVCLLTFLHHAAAQMRGPIVPLYAAAHGATPTGVGMIVGAHMAAAAAGSILLGRAADVWGRRPLLLAGMVAGVATSFLLPLVESELALATIYGLAGLGVAAFTPSALSLIGDAAAPGTAGRAYAWYSMAHYGAIGIGPFVGGLAAVWWGYGGAFVASAVGIGLALAVGLLVPLRVPALPRAGSSARFADIKDSATVWGGWLVSVSGLFVQGVVFTFFPLLGEERGLTPAGIGLVFLVLGLANTVARVPAGWLVDRTGRRAPYAIGGVLLASVGTMLLPHIGSQPTLLAVVAVFGAVSGIAFVAVSVALAEAATPASRGLVMGGYSTALYLGLAIGSITLGPVMTHEGYGIGFATGGATGAVGALLAGLVWARGRAPRPAPTGGAGR